MPSLQQLNSSDNGPASLTKLNANFTALGNSTLTDAQVAAGATGVPGLTSTGQLLDKNGYSVSGVLPIGLSATDAAANTAAILAAGACVLPVGSYPILPIARSGDLRLIAAIDGGTTLTSTADAAGYLIQCTGVITLDGLVITGAVAGIDGNTTTQGNQTGVFVDNQKRGVVRNCDISEFGLAGIGLGGAGTANYLGPIITGNRIHNNYYGIDSGIGGGLGEYCNISCNTINKNRYGYYCRSGNNNFTSNDMSLNGYGVVVDGTVTNGAHGNIVGNLINHSIVRSVWAFNGSNGHIVSNNQIFSDTGDIYLDTFAGLKFCNNNLKCPSITTAGTRHIEVHGNWLYSLSTTITDTTGGIASWKDNWSDATGTWIGGKSSFQVDAKAVYTSATGLSGVNKVSNGGFSSGTGWTPGAGWAIAGGVATATNTSAGLSQDIGVQPSKTYRVTADVTLTAGSYTFSCGGAGTIGPKTQTGSVAFDVPSNGAPTTLFYVFGTGFSGTIDNINVQEYQTIGDMSSDRVGAATGGYLYVGTTRYYSGAGSPEGVIAAPVGSEYTRTDGTAGTPAAPGTLKYTKTSGAGATGWSAVL